MRFWDSSAVVPLLLEEPPRARMLAVYAADPMIAVWWGTPVECVSAIARRERDGVLDLAGSSDAHARLQALRPAWEEIAPGEPVRARAQRLLRVHPLRAADALQLAAALVAAGPDPSSLEFVTLDDRLADAATREGLRVVAAI